MCEAEESFDNSNIDDFNVQAFVVLTPMLYEIANMPSDTFNFKMRLEGLSKEERS